MSVKSQLAQEANVRKVLKKAELKFCKIEGFPSYHLWCSKNVKKLIDIFKLVFLSFYKGMFAHHTKVYVCTCLSTLITDIRQLLERSTGAELQNEGTTRHLSWGRYFRLKGMYYVQYLINYAGCIHFIFRL